VRRVDVRALERGSQIPAVVDKHVIARGRAADEKQKATRKGNDSHLIMGLLAKSPSKFFVYTNAS
jgi:hypothetical protein